MAEVATPPRAERPPARRRAHPERPLQLVLILVGLGAVVILLGLFGTIAWVVALVVIVAGTVLSAAASGGSGWWKALALGALVSVLGALVALATGTLGGLLAVAGGVLVLVGAALGFPLNGPARE